MVIENTKTGSQKVDETFETVYPHYVLHFISNILCYLYLSHVSVQLHFFKVQ